MQKDCIIAISGPSGSGKTSVVRHLAETFPAYIESTAGNPYLSDLLAGRSQFNAYANQRWFLDRISDAVVNADVHMCFIIDQIPAAVVEVYAALFRDEDRIGEPDMNVLRRELEKIESEISLWAGGCFVLLLDASAEVLYHRAVSRAEGSPVPALAWFDEVRCRFLNVFQEGANVERLDTTNLSISEVRDAAIDFVNRKLGTSGEA